MIQGNNAKKGINVVLFLKAKILWTRTNLLAKGEEVLKDDIPV